jgi:hypothetical protein
MALACKALQPLSLCGWVICNGGHGWEAKLQALNRGLRKHPNCIVEIWLWAEADLKWEHARLESLALAHAPAYRCAPLP